MALPYDRLLGLSPDLISAHYGLYLDYLGRLAEVRRQIDSLDDCWPSDQALRMLFAEEGWLRNAVRLHELYFENLAPGGRGSVGLVDLRGSARWERQFRRLVSVATGWVILALDPFDGSCFNFVMDDHGRGYVAGAWPLLVCDCYEHAFLLDGLTRVSYADVFMANIDWAVVADRLAEARAWVEAA